MGKIHFNKDSRMRKFLTGKGFYLALAVCLVAVGAVAVATFTGSLPKLMTDNSSPSSQNEPERTTPRSTKDQQVDKPITNVPDPGPSTTAPVTPPTTKPSDVETNTKPTELFVLPLYNDVMNVFSDGKQVYSQTMNDWRTHNGVDFRGEKGQAVKALADGTIHLVENDPLWGDVVEIDHGYGIRSRYCGVKTTLKAGDKVTVNQEIGHLTDIPCEMLEDPHLHLEILVDGAYTDPVKALGRDVKYSNPTQAAE